MATEVNVLRQPVATISFNSADLGWTKEPFELSVSSTYLMESNQQLMGSAFKKLLTRDVKGKTVLHEGTLANAALCMGQLSTSVSAATLSINNSEVAAASLVVVGAAGSGPSSTTRTFTFPKASPSGNFTMSVSKNASASLNFEFDALYDTSTSKYGTIVDA
jgi:hypothetical protein